jgi:hypothetical protein
MFDLWADTSDGVEVANDRSTRFNQPCVVIVPSEFVPHAAIVGGLAEMKSRITELERELAAARGAVSKFLEYYRPFMDDAAGWMEQSCTEMGLPLPFSHAETIRRMHSELISLAADPTEGQEVKG